MRARILILGYGNTLRGDDGLGCRAAERLTHLDGRSGVRVIAAHQLGIDFAELVADAELVVFIDASREGLPGELRTSNVRSLPATEAEAVMTHHLTPETLLAVSRVLYGGAPEAVVVTLTGAAFDLSEELSPIVQAELPGLVQKVERLVRKHAEQFEPGSPA
ncbi:MAG: hydrogenase maturation protease [Thermoanaerobaculia bacterium]